MNKTMIFYQHFKDNLDELIFIYPDGKCEVMIPKLNFGIAPSWASERIHTETSYGKHNVDKVTTYSFGIFKNKKHAIKTMKQYNKRKKYKNPVFLGEL